MKRVLIKVSGEMLLGKDSAIDKNALTEMAHILQKAYHTGTQIAVVIGAGNIIRGGSTDFLLRTKADQAGMLGTAINAIALQDILQRELSVSSVVLGAFPISGMFQQQSPKNISNAFKDHSIIIFAGGTGAPFFSTDTAVVLKALEIKADILIKATKVDGVYDKDPVLYSDAVKYDRISYQDAISQQLKVMDLTALSLAMENRLPIRVTKLSSENIIGIINGKEIGTLVCG